MKRSPKEIIPMTCDLGFPISVLYLFQDCNACTADIKVAIDECTDGDGAALECVEDALDAVADCIICICEVAAIIGGVPIRGCDP